MLPFKKILCPTDFSEPSYEALKVANELALYFSSELFVLHVVQPIPTVNVPPPSASTAVTPKFDISLYRQELIKLSERSLKEIADQRLSKELNFNLIVKEGEAADQIIDVVGKQCIDLIVIATQGRTGWRRFIFGSVAEKVIRLAPCPVFTIKAPQ